MGIIHVLTGPDHLSALATLSANIDSCQAFGYGVRWGIGHSIGLLLVGSILIMIDYSNHDKENDNNNDDKIGISESFESFCETLVGIFMVCLGLYGLRSTYLKHRGGSALESDVNGENSNDTLLSSRFDSNNYCNSNSPNKKRNDDEESGVFELSPSTASTKRATIQNGEASMSLADVSYDAMGTTTSQMNNDRNISSLIHHHHSHDHHECCNDDNHCCNCCPSCKFSKPILSLCIGIVHGVAGPGGVLGVIPAVQLHNWKLATFYLLTFCAVSTLTMGSYSALYGTFSSYISTGNAEVMEYRVELFSSGLSLFVGVMWLFLLSIGKLHDIFP